MIGLKQYMLWFAFELVSLNHWKQRYELENMDYQVVICFRISIFEPLKTTGKDTREYYVLLWFAFELVSLNHWKQHYVSKAYEESRCDLLSN